MANYRTSPRNEVIIAARRRGIAGPAIATALGMTSQRVHQIYQAFERQNGNIGVVARRKRSHYGRVLERCETCGALTDRSVGESGKRFCTPLCANQSKRVLFAHHVEFAISLRRNGETWSHVKALLKKDVQTIQKSIWYDLERRGMLTTDLVKDIWKPANHPNVKPPSWEWLIKSTRIAPIGDKRRDPNRTVAPVLKITKRLDA